MSLHNFIRNNRRHWIAKICSNQLEHTHPALDWHIKVCLRGCVSSHVALSIYDKFDVPAVYSICVQIPITKLDTYIIKHGNWAEDK
jgi:hypothetical protein